MAAGAGRSRRDLSVVRILFIAPYIPSPIRVRPFHFIRELARHHKVAVLATGTGRELADAARLRTMCQAVEVVPFTRSAALRSCLAATMRGIPLQAAVCQSPAFRRRLRDLLATGSFDLVHLEHLRASRLIEDIPDALPRVYDSVDCISLLLDRTRRSSHSARQRLIAMLELRRTQAYEAQLLARFDKVVVTSPDDASALGALNPSADITVVPNGVDLASFAPFEGPREAATLVFSGKMSYHANATAALHFVKEIFPAIRAVVPEARLRIVGSAPPPSIRELARDPAIEVTGYVPDLRAAIGTATVAVCPVTVKVGIQNKVLEAMAAGLPVVCSREGTAGLAARAGGDYLVADDSDGFARDVCRLLADPALRDDVGRAGRQYVESHHRWSAVVNQLEQCYSEAKASHDSR